MLAQIRLVGEDPSLQPGTSAKWGHLCHRVAAWVVAVYSYGCPVIFLDVDGVCHPVKPSGHALYASMDALVARCEAEAELPEDATASTVEGEFISECMGALAKCVHSTSARIVLSSTWRETAPQRRAVEAQLKAHGVVERMCGCTPRLTSLEGGRVAEILQWVDLHNPARWVALDDMDLSKLPAGHFVHIDPAKGLTGRDAARVEELLSMSS